MAIHTPLARPELVHADDAKRAAIEERALEFAKHEEEARQMTGEADATGGQFFGFRAERNPAPQEAQPTQAQPNAQPDAGSQVTATAEQDQDAAADEMEDSDIDGSGEPGESSGEAPKWVKQRLAREKKKQEALQNEIKELKAKLGDTSEDEGTETEPAKQEAKTQKRVRPERSDYDSDGQYLEDVEAFDGGLPLVHDPLGLESSETDVEQTDASETKEDAATYYTQLMKDLRSEMKARGEGELALYESFVEKMKSRDIQLTSDMLEYMLSEGDALAIMHDFVRRPGHARVLARRQVKEERIKGLMDITASSKQEADTEQPASAESPMPDITHLPTQAAPLEKKIEDMSFEEFEAWAKRKEESRGTFGFVATRAAA